MPLKSSGGRSFLKLSVFDGRDACLDVVHEIERKEDGTGGAEERGAKEAL